MREHHSGIQEGGNVKVQDEFHREIGRLPSLEITKITILHNITGDTGLHVGSELVDFGCALLFYCSTMFINN